MCAHRHTHRRRVTDKAAPASESRSTPMTRTDEARADRLAAELSSAATHPVVPLSLSLSLSCSPSGKGEYLNSMAPSSIARRARGIGLGAAYQQQSSQQRTSHDRRPSSDSSDLPWSKGRGARRRRRGGGRRMPQTPSAADSDVVPTTDRCDGGRSGRMTRMRGRAARRAVGRSPLRREGGRLFAVA
jgi:hypothetical protein